MSDQQKTPRVKISGLWVNETKDGQQYMSGANGTTRYSIWPNGFKEKETDPSHVLYVEPVQKRQAE